MAFSTRRSMLSRIARGDEVGWRGFYETYAPLIRLRGGDRGLDSFEREELVQETVISIFQRNSVLRYDPGKGRFRDFLKGIIDKKAVDIVRRRAKERPGADSPAEDGLEVAAGSSLEAAWDDEWRRHILRQAFEELKGLVSPVEFQAFDLYAVKGWSPADTADFLGVSPGTVYSAKNRCLKQLREIARRLGEE